MQLEIKDVSVSFERSGAILDHVNVSIDQGEFVGLVGRSGSGKTTLLETAGGLINPNSGIVLFHGQNIHSSGFDWISFRRKLQIVFQFPENQFFETDVKKEISFGPYALKMAENEVEMLITQSMEKVGLDHSHFFEMSPFMLSGGEKRRLALACALAVNPDILLLDEPFAGLDKEGQERLIETLQNEHRDGKTILLVSHNPDLLCEMSDRIIVLSDGKIVQEGKPSEIYNDSGFCQLNGIGRPNTSKAAELLKIDLESDLSYNSFLNKLVKDLSEQTND